MSRRTIGAACGIAAATIILMLPGVGTLEPIGVRALAIIVLGVVFWATDVLNAGITAIMVLGLLLVAGVPGHVSPSAGFAASAFWILVVGPVLRLRDGQDGPRPAHRVPDPAGLPADLRGHPRRPSSASASSSRSASRR